MAGVACMAGGHAWWGCVVWACVAVEGACMAGEGGMCGRGMHGGGGVGQGACVVGGMYDRGHVWWEACMTGWHVWWGSYMAGGVHLTQA